MEDASDDPLTSTDTMPVPLKNGEVLPTQEPEIASEKETSSDSKSVKVNGDAKGEDSDAVDSSDCDNLVIDERPQNNRKRKLLSLESKGGFRGFKRLKSENEYEPPTNPYFNESLFELSELHQKKNVHSLDKNCEENSKSGDSNDIQGAKDSSNPSAVATAQPKKGAGKKNKKNGSPKLREYAQYLGLQPTVQFKCSRCAQSGFPSLAVLNEHHKQCRALGPVTPPTSSNSSSSPSTNFRVTRKVFLCSACGTYYENWNLFLHMREVHKRFICLYCLGMFSLPEKLSLHLVSKHNCVPNQLNSEEDFFQAYKEPCFLMCCDCEKVFSERDNFFGHNCLGRPIRNNTDNKNKNVANINKHLANQKQVVSKNSKQVKSKTFVEHVTGDMPETETHNPKENDTMEPVNSDNTPEQQDQEKSENNLSPPEENNKENAEANGENDLETNSNSSADGPSQVEEEINTNPEVSNNNSDVTETTTEVKDVKSETELPKNNETTLDTTEYNHVQSKESASEDELDELEELEESATDFPTKQDSESSLEIATANDEEDPNSHINTEEQDDELDETGKSEPEPEETRKVPKVTLKLPKSITTNYDEHEDSDGSDKLTMELDSMEAEDEMDFNADISDEKENKDYSNIFEPSMAVAGTDIPIVELELEQPLDKFDIQVLLQKCLKATVPTCVYCNHARKIAVNGKQLGLHAIAEHRFSAIVNSITAEELIPESFVMRIKEGLPELQDVYFNLESTSSDEGITFSHVFECFQCRYATTVHKELYLHNRKMHAKTILLCIMCKSNFYSYSELICHLCPGLYELNNDVSFRCCMCVSDDLPSAFRLMVHLRKRHHACDVCLELCHNQSRLSNHVWKHKLHHLCYRCGIAYRNKPDITKHLFWKHGTESVLCKKCLQKKWPHVYHFCIPPSNFTCEECNLNFARAVSLKVHKRLHTDEKPHVCSFENCTEKFISKKLLLKHEFKHREPPEESLDKNHAPVSEDTDLEPTLPTNVSLEEKPEEAAKDEAPEEDAPKPKPKVDVYDLPELNLSESDSSDSEEEAQTNEKKEEAVLENEKIPERNITPTAEDDSSKSENVTESTAPEGVTVEQPAPVLENIWDDFKNYQASKKMETLGTGPDAPELEEVEPVPSTSQADNSEENRQQLVTIVMMDHDYSVLSQEYKTDTAPEVIERTQSMDHDYCSANNQKEPTEQEQPAEAQKIQSPTVPKEKKETKASSSSDSSDSDSSSCTCGSNCSCSSSSDSSSSSSDSSDSDSSSSEGRRKQQARRERRKQRAKNKNKESENSPIDVVATDQQPSAQVEQLIQESDLDTTETDTDEDFYDKQPQKVANKLIAEKRKELLLLAGIGPLINGSVLESSRPSTPSLPETEEVKPKKKSKNKKKKKKNRRQEEKPLPTLSIPSTSYQYQYQPSIVSPLTISLPKNSPLTTPTPIHASPPVIVGNTTGFAAEEQMLAPNAETTNALDSSLRASKRRRIPNKFYGYSSDDERERHQPPVFKWRKADLPSPVRPAPSSPLVVPPITIKTVPTIAVAEDPQPPRPSLQMSELRVQHPGLMQQNFQAHHSKALIASQAHDQESSTESNESTSEEEQPPQFINKPNQPPLYCYCRCPYDEVSEMIGCDANDCMIEWFHFECVGIMVPPKGQWFCPDCRKKKQQRKELAQT